MNKLYAILVSLFSFCCYSQIRFESGYIVTTNNQKIICLIKNGDWRNTPESFDYRISEDAATQKATTNNTTEVSVAGQTFTRFTVNMDRSSDELSSISTNSEPILSRETVFLKLLVKGDACLYKYYDAISLRYFYTTNVTYEPVALTYKMYRGENNKILYNKTYKSALQKLMSSKVADPQLYKNLDYKDKDMIALFRKYNGLTEESTINTTPVLKGKLHLKVGAEARMISLEADFMASVSSNYKFDSKVIPAFGAEVEWIMPFNRNKWGLFFAPYYHTYKNSGTKTFGTGNSTVENKWSARYTAVELNLGGRYYMYLSEDARIFLNGGFVFSKGFNDSGLNYTRTLDGTTTLSVQAFTKQQSSFFAGVGFAYKNISGEIRYHGKHSINGGYGGWASEYGGVGLLIQYSIF